VFGVIDKTIEVEDLIMFFKKIDLLWNETPPQKEKPQESEAKEGEGDEGEGAQAEGENNTQEKSKAVDKSQTKEEQPPAEAEGEQANEDEEGVDDQSELHECPVDKITLKELLDIIEKYYNPKAKLSYVIEKEIDRNDYNKEYNTHKLVNKYYMHTRGSELIMFEFKEILLEIALLLKDKKEAGNAAGKPKIRAMLKRFFLQDTVLKRSSAFKDQQVGAPMRPPSLVWPDSEKDILIKKRKEEERLRILAEKKKKEEEERQQRELELMAAEDHPVLSPEEIEELRKKQEEEEARLKQMEQEAAEEEDDDELDDDDDEEVNDSELVDDY
jgi:hypothetical protein